MNDPSVACPTGARRALDRRDTLHDLLTEVRGAARLLLCAGAGEDTAREALSLWLDRIADDLQDLEGPSEAGESAEARS